MTVHREADLRMVGGFVSSSFLWRDQASLFLKENIISLQEFGAEVGGTTDERLTADKTDESYRMPQEDL